MTRLALSLVALTVLALPLAGQSDVRRFEVASIKPSAPDARGMMISGPAPDQFRTVNAPLDRIILETDCPYLAPVPHRGRRNEPAYLVDVCRAFAEHRGMTFEAAAELTTKNAIKLFARPA